MGAKLTEKEKLIQDIAYLNPEDWRKVRLYVTKLRQLERMDAKVKYAVETIKTATGTQFGYNDREIRCDFCGKYREQVQKMVSGPGVYICDECISLCNEIIEEEV